MHWTLKTKDFVCTVCVLDFRLKDEFPIKPKSHSNSHRFHRTMDEKWTQMKIFHLFIWCLTWALFGSGIVVFCETKNTVTIRMIEDWITNFSHGCLFAVETYKTCVSSSVRCVIEWVKWQNQLCTFNPVQFRILIR